MDLIGGGAKSYPGFLKFLGDEKPLGSPFQIDFPKEAPEGYIPLDPRPRNCYDANLESKCACVDCPSICPALPYQPTPDERSRSCQIGGVTCLSFILLVTYGLAALSFLIGFAVQKLLRKKRDRSYERVALSGDTSSSVNQNAISQPFNGSGSNAANRSSLVGASSLALHFDGDDSAAASDPARHHLGRGASLLDPIETLQPRQYKLNTILRRAFYRMGYTFASYPWLTFVVVFTMFGGLNYGWKYFEVETDPVRLWVAPGSESRIQKEFFDEHFGPFYRPQQIFITAPSTEPSLTQPVTNSSNVATDLQPVLSWERLTWLDGVQRHIASIETEDGITLDDVCFKPAGPDGECVIQSILAWFGDLDDWSKDTWKDRVLQCAESPGDQECLPPFGQPLAPPFILGGIEKENYLDAPSLVLTYILDNSLDPEVLEKAESWERLLRAYLTTLADEAPNKSGSQVFFSTGVSLEEELNKSTNTDVRIVVLSYLVMFIYVSLTLGSNSAEGGSIIGSLYTWIVNLPLLFRRKNVTSSPIGSNRPRPTWYPRLPRRLFIGSKFFLGLFGIILVILSVAASVGLFSFLHVRVTLIIAEVIPFLVLAVGVDNVFILVHELDRQNALHGPNAQLSALTGNGPNGPMSPSSFRSPFASTNDDSDGDGESMPIHLPAEERVARAVAKMGPSILLSTVTETVAFALGAMVPMPAVRNFALYAAGSVFLNAVLQITVFVSAMTVDLRRAEVGFVLYFAVRSYILNDWNYRPTGWIVYHASGYHPELLSLRAVPQGPGGSPVSSGGFMPHSF